MASTLTGKGNAVTITGSPDSRWDYADLNTLWRVNISDFEAVDVSSLMVDENSAQAREIPGGDPIPTPTPTPAPALSDIPSPAPTTALIPSS